MSEDLCYQAIGELAAQLESKQISPVELTRAYLERIRELDGKLNSYITLTEDTAIRQARRAEAEILAGRYRGPLHGVPYAVKDLVATKGIRTTWGSRLFEDQVPDHDATIIERLRGAGAILLGKLSMSELAFGGRPEAALNGPVHNPWKLDHWTFGSSTGPAASVAAGLAAFAIGSETTTSILRPASSTGIVGLRPTYGRVSRYGIMPLSWTMDKVGPMARRAADCATVLASIHGADPRDPTSVTAPFDFLPEKRIAGRRVGVVRAEFEQLKSLPVEETYRQALDVLQGLGVILEDIQLPNFPYREVTSFIWQVEGFSVFQPWARDGRLQRSLVNKDRWIGWRAAALIPAPDYMKALRIRQAIVRAVGELTRRFDVLVAPMNPLGARPIEPPADGNTSGRPDLEARLQYLGTLVGIPTISVPCGFTPRGLPVGLAFAAGGLRDGAACQMAHAFEQATGWHRRRPTFRE